MPGEGEKVAEIFVDFGPLANGPFSALVIANLVIEIDEIDPILVAVGVNSDQVAIGADGTLEVVDINTGAAQLLEGWTIR